MNVDNETCRQSIRFSFLFFDTCEWGQTSTPWQRVCKDKAKTSEALREGKDFLSTRLERIAAMMEVLMRTHQEWIVTSRKDRVIMETDTLDFNQALQALREDGFRDKEFILTVEYTRKWGLL